MNLYAQDRTPDIYRGFQRVLIAQNRIENALEVAEQGRYRALSNLFVTRLGIEPKLPPASTPPNIARIKEVAKTFNSTLVEYSIIYNDNQVNQFSGYRLRFDDPFAYAETLFIWVVQPTGKISFRQVNLKRKQDTFFLSTLVRSLRESLHAKSQNFPEIGCQPPFQYLYQFLIEPIADLLPHNPESRVIFIPQDFLFLVPFCALQDSSGCYLIQKHTILTAPSIFSLELTLENQQITRGYSPTANACLVVGNPLMPSIYQPLDEVEVVLPALPTAELEAGRVAELLKTQALIGFNATKKSVLNQLSNSQIIHLATHILGEEIEGLAGAIALTPSANDGFLRFTEVLQHKITADLVVLSAFDSTRNKLLGDSIVIISSGFIAMGALSVVLSLWSNPISQSHIFMQYFYQNLRATGDKALSLRNAILATMQDYPHPKDWAGFMLIGQPSTRLD